MRLVELTTREGHPIFVDPDHITGVFTNAQLGTSYSAIHIADMGNVILKGTASEIAKKLRGAPATKRRK